MRKAVAWWSVIALLGVTVGCEEVPNEPRHFSRSQGLDAFCTAQVIGTGAVDVETDYIPHVIQCENGAASLEALKAQAVAARSYLYYRMETAGEIGDGQSDQVYSCGSQPSAIHYQAAQETAGQVLTYDGEVIAAFYVAGAVPSDKDTCVAQSGDNDYSNTEHYVTYNWGKSGDGIEQTTLGWVSPSNIYNRGCKSQNGADCLSDSGWGYQDILRFYYGMDIGIETAVGACVEPVACTPSIDSDSVVIDDLDSCFVANGCSSWRELSAGWEGHALWTYAWDEEADCSARWRLNFAQAGNYELALYIEPAGGPMSAQALYSIQHAGQLSTMTLDMSGATGWVSMGSFTFAAGEEQWVELSDATGEPYTDTTNSKRLVFDALRVERLAEPVDDSVLDGDDLVDLVAEDVVVDIAQDFSSDSLSDTPGDSGEADQTDQTDQMDSSSEDDAIELAEEGDLQHLSSDGSCACSVRATRELPFATGFSIFWLALGLIGWRRRH